MVAAQSPHKFAWYYGDPRKYNSLLAGKTVGNAVNHGGMVEIKAGNATLLSETEQACSIKQKVKNYRISINSGLNSKTVHP